MRFVALEQIGNCKQGSLINLSFKKKMLTHIQPRHEVIKSDPKCKLTLILIKGLETLNYDPFPS